MGDVSPARDEEPGEHQGRHGNEPVRCEHHGLPTPAIDQGSDERSEHDGREHAQERSHRQDGRRPALCRQPPDQGELNRLASEERQRLATPQDPEGAQVMDCGSGRIARGSRISRRMAGSRARRTSAASRNGRSTTRNRVSRICRGIAGNRISRRAAGNHAPTSRLVRIRPRFIHGSTLPSTRARSDHAFRLLSSSQPTRGSRRSFRACPRSARFRLCP